MRTIITSIFLILCGFLITANSQDNSMTMPTETVKLCPVSGEALFEGKTVTFNYLGKTYEFCCEGCLAKFKKEPMDYIKGEVMCPVMGEAASKEYSLEYNGVKYYVCCPPCIKKFNKEPEKYLQSGAKEDHK